MFETEIVTYAMFGVAMFMLLLVVGSIILISRYIKKHKDTSPYYQRLLNEAKKMAGVSDNNNDRRVDR